MMIFEIRVVSDDGKTLFQQVLPVSPAMKSYNKRFQEGGIMDRDAEALLRGFFLEFDIQPIQQEHSDGEEDNQKDGCEDPEEGPDA